MSDKTTYVVISNTNVEVPTHSVIAAWLSLYDILLSDRQLSQVQLYIGILVFWNQKVNLTSILDLQEIVCRHFGESFYCARFLPNEQSRLADVGSGAGFPGLALKIILPRYEVFLIEQDTRKSTFLNEVIRALQMDSVKVLRTHYETMTPDFADLDVVIARAIGNHKSLLKWAFSRLTSNGQVILLLGLEDATRVMRIRGWNWSIPRPMPQSSKRVILLGKMSK